MSSLVQAEDVGRSPGVLEQAEGGRALADEAVAAFGAVIDELTDLRTLHKSIGTYLEQYAGLACGKGAANETGGETGGGEALLSGLDGVETALKAVVSGLSDGARLEHVVAGRSHLASILKSEKSLRAVASLTRTMASSLGITTLSGYLDALLQAAASIGSSASDVCELLDQLASREAQMLGQCRRSAVALSRLAEDVRARQPDLEKLNRAEQGIAAQIAKTANTLTEEGKSHLKGLVSAIQFSDRFAQRLDHFASATDIDDGHVAHLAAAQARGAVSDLEATAERIRDAMAGMTRLGNDGAKLFTEKTIVHAISDGVASRMEILGPIIADLAETEEVINVLREEAQLAAQSAVLAQESFEALEFSCKALFVESINSMLLSRQSGSTHGPLAVLSNEVRETAVRCLEALEGSKVSLAAVLSEVEATHAPLIEESSRLQDAVAKFQSQTEADRSRLQEIQTLGVDAQGAANDLLDLVDRVGNAMAVTNDVGRRLASQAAQLESRPTQGEPDPEILARIWASYTMDEERLIHADMFGDPHGQDGAEAAPESDDIDDLLF